MLALLFCAFLSASAEGQTIRKVQLFGPALGSVSSGEVAVVNSGLVYSAGSTAFGGHIGVIDPATNDLIKIIHPANPDVIANITYSLVDQTNKTVYFAYPTQPSAQIISVDGRPNSETFNQFLPPIAFANKTLGAFAIDETRNRLYATTRNSSGTQGQVEIVDIDPASATYHQTLSTLTMPAGQVVRDIAVNAVTNKIYVATTSSGGGVYYFDGAQPVLTFIMGTKPAGPIAIDQASNSIYAVSWSGSSIQAINGVTDLPITSVSLPSGQTVANLSPENVAVNPITGRIYAVLFDSSLVVISSNRSDPAYNTIIATVPQAGYSAVAVDAVINKVAVGGRGNSTNIVDGATNTIVATAFGNLTGADVTIDTSTHRAYAAYTIYTTQSIDLNTYQSVDVSTSTEFGTPVIDTLNDSLYIGCTSTTSGVAFLDRNNDLGFIGGAAASGTARYILAARNAVTNRVYAVDSAPVSGLPANIKVIDANTKTIIATILPGAYPAYVPTVNEQTNKIYLENGELSSTYPSSISVIDGANNTASFVNTSAFPSGTTFAGGITANPLTNRIYFGTGTGAGVIDGNTDVASPLAGIAYIYKIQVNTNLNRVYFLTSTRLQVLNGTNDVEVANIAVGYPTDLAIDHTTNRIYVLGSSDLNGSNRTLTMIDGNTNTIINTISVPNARVLSEVDERHGLILLGNIPNLYDENASSITFVNVDDLSIRKVLPIRLRPGRIAMNPLSGRAYVITGNAFEHTGIVVLSSAPTANIFDFDGDGKSDESVFRPSNDTWYLNGSQVGFTGYQFGVTDDLLTPADFTGDGKTDVAVFRPSTGTWFVLKSEDNTFYGTQFGANGDIPAPGDYDGDGKADTAVFRPLNGTWFIQGSTTGFTATQFGTNGDVPTVGDFDGDGKSDVAVFRPSNGTWFRLNSSNGAFVGAQFGQSGDKVVAADYTGDGKTDIAVWRPSEGTWYIQKSEDNSFYGVQFGMTGDLPTPGDYDGDGKADVAVFRPSNGTWFEQRSTSGFAAVQFGVSGDKPVPNAFVY